jgi:dGTPase
MDALNSISNLDAKDRIKKDYERLLSSQRLRPTRDDKRAGDLNLETFSDKGRIVRSAPFRRLNSKAQVFSMARSGAVRTRLTHSLEVANYGELIADPLARKLVTNGSLPATLRLAFVQMVENSCLLHDIGNPPFGHMGEYAIQQWFTEKKPELVSSWVALGKLTREEAESHLDPYTHFDGNPHGFRIITRLQWLNDEYGMNLTCSLLASYLKYLGTQPESGRFRKKTGYFSSEEGVVKSVWKKLGLRTDTEGLPDQRHPLTFVMEAADDIAFCLSDIEDALEKRVVTEAEFIAWMKTKNYRLENLISEATKQSNLVRNGTYHLFRLERSKELVESAVNAYLQYEDKILHGLMEKSLLSVDPEAKRLLELLKEFCVRHVYTSREAIDTELVGLNAITGVLNAYFPVMCMTTEQFKEISNIDNKDRLSNFPIPSLLYSLLPEKHRLAYKWYKEQNPRFEPVYRAQLVVDYVAGMTDSHVLKIFNMINGSQQFGLE